jgi:hypothetical protein
MMKRDPFAWAPEPVRPLFREAGFGTHCAHGVARFLMDRIVWVAQCPFDCTGVGARHTGAVFALGHQREVPNAALVLPVSESMTGQRVLQMIGTPVPAPAQRRWANLHAAELADLLLLAIMLGVDSWARTEGRCRGACGRPIPNGDPALAGFVCGVPTCLIAPPARDEQIRAALAGMTSSPRGSA